MEKKRLLVFSHKFWDDEDDCSCSVKMGVARVRPLKEGCSCSVRILEERGAGEGGNRMNGIGGCVFVRWICFCIVFFSLGGVRLEVVWVVYFVLFFIHVLAFLRNIIQHQKKERRGI